MCFLLLVSVQLWQQCLICGCQDQIMTLLLQSLNSLTKVACHIIIELFEAPNIFSVVLAKWMKVILDEFNLTNKVIAYVKDEGTNLNSFTIAFTSVVSCELLQLP
jgi:hypothetical protein